MLRNIGTAEGIIIATIITSHMSKKLAADAAQVCPGIRNHIMDMVQPPGISISQHMERQKYAVAPTLARKATPHAKTKLPDTRWSGAMDSKCCTALFTRFGQRLDCGTP
jgi:hypothetical protein